MAGTSSEAFDGRLDPSIQRSICKSMSFPVMRAGNMPKGDCSSLLSQGLDLLLDQLE